MSTNFYKEKNKKNDYFFKWSSSYIKSNDINLRNVFANLNKKKYLNNTKKALNYIIGDDIFSSYNMNPKKAYFYYNKNMLFLDFFFRLTKKDKMIFKRFYFFHMYNDYNLINLNYLNLLNYKYWDNKFYFSFFFKLILNIKKGVVNFILNYIYLYIKKKIQHFYHLFSMI